MIREGKKIVGLLENIFAGKSKLFMYLDYISNGLNGKEVTG